MYILPDEYVLSGDVAEDSNGNENGHENGNENGNGDGDNYDSYEPELSAMPSELVAPDSMDDGLDWSGTFINLKWEKMKWEERMCS